MKTTLFENVSWLIAWDRDTKNHVYLNDVDMAFEGGSLTFIGKNYSGIADRKISGKNKMIMPGFVNIHSHPASEPIRRSMTDETLSPGFHHSSLYEYLPVFESDAQSAAASMQVAIAELLKSGVTTLVDLSVPFEGWLDLLGESGMRVCIAPMYRDARWFTENGHRLEYEWDQQRGQASMEAAFRLVELARQHPSGRLTGMLCPAQIDTCSAELLQESHSFSTERGIPLQIHVSQSVTEFHEMYRRHGRTPVQWMDDLGILDDRSILGHAIFLDHHPWLHWTSRRDLPLLAERRATVAHCPTVFVRRGISLHSFGSYLRSGVNVGIGTDTYPHNFLAELRVASYTARTIAESVADHTAAELFHAATVGGAGALKRDDIGRLSTGAKADFVVVDLDDPAMRPVYDPMRTLVYSADDRVIRDVWIDGREVVKDGRVLTIDLEAATSALEEAQAKILKRIPDLDWANRPIETLAPRSLDVRA